MYSRIGRFCLCASFPQKEPFILPLNEIQIPTAVVSLLTGCLERGGESAALREGCGFQSETISAKVLRIARIERVAASGAHGVQHFPFAHPITIVGYADGGVFTIALEINPDVAGLSENAVVNEVSNRVRKIIAKGPERFAHRGSERFRPITASL